MAREIAGEKIEPEDVSTDRKLRPDSLAEYIGQGKVKDKLAVYLAAAKKRCEPLDHCLFFGPPGLGKTTLAHIIAREMSAPITSTSGPIIERQGDLAAILTNLEPGSILFIDEIHRLNRAVEEILYQAMEDFKLDILIGQGPGARTIKLDLPQFTLVGATTRAGLLTSPLRDRFGIVERLEFYQPEDLAEIARRSAAILEILSESEGLTEIARRARGTPRIVNRLLRRVRDFAQVKGNGCITTQAANHALEVLGIDHLGFDELDRRLLLTLIEKYAGGPVGLDTLAASLQEEAQTVEDVLEPFLIQQGLIQRTPRGRLATKLAYTHLGLERIFSEQNSQKKLFE